MSAMMKLPGMKRVLMPKAPRELMNQDPAYGPAKGGNDGLRGDVLVDAERAERPSSTMSEALNDRPSADALSYRSLDLGMHALSSNVLDRKISAFEHRITALKSGVREDREALPQVIDRLITQRSDLEKAHSETLERLAYARSELRSVELLLEDARGRSADAARVPQLAPRDDVSNVSQLGQRLAAAEQDVEAIEQALHANSRVRAYLHEEVYRLTVFARGSQRKFSAVAADLERAEVCVKSKKADVADNLKSDINLAKLRSKADTAAIAVSAPGFAPEDLASHGKPLLDILRMMADLLPEDDIAVERALPRVAVMEMIVRGLAVATGSDVEKAIELAEALMSCPLNQWVPLPNDKTSENAPYRTPNESMTELFCTMAAIPRGLDALQFIAGSAADDAIAAQPLEPAQLAALQAYWQAFRARRSETLENVRAWLGDAMDVAAHQVRNAKESVVFGTDGIPLKKQAAFNAVRNGFLSNAPGSDYDLSNRNLINQTNVIKGQKPPRPVVLKWLPRSANPGEDASPFHPRSLRFAQKLMEAQGMPTRKSLAEDKIIATFSALRNHAQSHLDRLRKSASDTGGIPAAREADRQLCSVIVALSDYVMNRTRNLGASIRFPVSPRSLNYRSPMAPRSFDQVKRLYDAHFDAEDMAQIRKMASQAQSSSNTAVASIEAGELIWGKAAVLPPVLNASAGQKRVPIVEVMKALHEAIEGSTDEMKSAMGPALEALRRDVVGRDAKAMEKPKSLPKDGSGRLQPRPRGQALAKHGTIEESISKAKSSSIESNEDIENFFRPMLEAARLRDQVTLTGGGTIGFGIPILAPVTPVFPLSAQAHLASKRSESFLQFKNPTFAAEIIAGSVVSWQHDARVAVGYRLPFGAGTFTASGNARLDASRSTTVYTTLRTLRGKDERGNRKVQESIDDNLKLLDILLRWPDMTDEKGERYDFEDPLQAIFALSPDTVVASGEKRSRSRQGTLEARTAVRGRVPGHHFSAGLSVTPVSVRVAKASEQNTERTGYAHQRAEDRNDQALQRIGLSTQVGFNGVPYKHSFVSPRTDSQTGAEQGRTTGTARVYLIGNLLEYSRELCSNLEKNGATRFSIGDATGGSVDRVYASPKDLLAEIESNREDWLIRCLDVLPRAKDEDPGTSERLARAENLLDRFAAGLCSVGAHPNFQFNIKYEMQPRMSGMIDGLRAVQALAERQGDKPARERARSAIGDLLSYRASWAPKNMTLRSRGKLSQETGIDFFLRWQKIASAETSRVALAFPV
ncbi:hypothetical protein GWC77_25810 [Paraburkholderia sp. NMBU_R16]|uniref:hypothetical protein n=1 Tax=Paraburkholderia sp. NMBU_R16 TaxID=2698676 RepID=UPI001566BA96|nr:hypothetical protein [Paraburkholderia sp. NMBU_R16]NRO99306.1 hypothetical protein [Paraburkholderia sp. NMBU_R16]